MIDVGEWLQRTLGLSPLAAACAVVRGAADRLGHHRPLPSADADQPVINGLRDLRLDLFRHLETRPSSFYDRVAVGRIMTRVTNDVEALYELLRGIGTLIGEFVPFFVALVIMLAVDVKLTVIMLLVMPVMGGVTYTFQRITRQLVPAGAPIGVGAEPESAGEPRRAAGGAAVAAPGIQRGAISARSTRATATSRCVRCGSKRCTARSPTASRRSRSALVVWYGAGAVLQEHVSLGGVILFTRFIDMLFHPIVVLGEQTNILFRAMASGERIFQALDWDEKIHEPATPAPLPPRLRGEVEFRHVNFGYDAEHAGAARRLVRHPSRRKARDRRTDRAPARAP